MTTVRGLTVSYLRPGEGLSVRCDKCNRTKVMSKDDLIRLFGSGAELSRLHERLRCVVCRNPPAEMSVTWPHQHER
jgi:hypothetical protein